MFSFKSIRTVVSDLLLLSKELRTIVFMFAFVLVVIIHSLRQKKNHGLPIWPILGMLPSLLLGLRSGVYDWLTNILNHQSGTFVFKGPWFTSFNYVVTSKPKNLKYLLSTNFSNFAKGESFNYIARDVFGEGFFNSDGVAWLLQRRAVSAAFHSNEFRSMTVESLVDLVHRRLFSILDNSIKSGNLLIDLQDLLLRLSFDNICILAFGVDTGTLNLGLPNIPFVKAFEEATCVTLLRFFTPALVWRAMRFLNLGRERRLKTSIREVHDFVDEVIHTKKKDILSKSTRERFGSNILTTFIAMKDDKGSSVPEKILRDTCVSLILGGRDTSSIALAWFFWFLDQNSVVEEKILAEIYRIVGERETGSDKGGKEANLVVMPEEVKRMEYLHAALTESLRLYPSVPLEFREVVEDDVFPDGTTLKKGTKVIYSIHAVGRMKSVWGKDCMEFKPERWLTDGKFAREPTYKFTAFNGGPRDCLGKDFAYYQMKFIAASIIHRYCVKVERNHPVVPKLSLSMYMKYGLKVTISSRRCEN
ncbi:hypothetical protein GIB67_019437 [Kingdonia uniflora]|uniref:Cytochrome P450 n=1 Tax=Kingdonia uniflora TaxID=39325 RepID=A0A7J7MUN9_9MAGN|nr:hypothetical protein GIB67_019437 [Kingdonia uniflora]